MLGLELEINVVFLAKSLFCDILIMLPVILAAFYTSDNVRAGSGPFQSRHVAVPSRS